MSTTGKSVKVQVVTPERAVLDEAAEFVVLPLFDGELGVMPGHAAFVGQLAPGELKLKTGGDATRYYIEGGFAQVRANVVNVLTAAAIKAEDVTPAKATDARTAADALPATDAVTRENKRKATERAQGLAKVAAKNG